MTIGRILYILGILIAIYALISGFKFHASNTAGVWDYFHQYSLKFGTLVGGVVLIVIGKKLGKK